MKLRNVRLVLGNVARTTNAKSMPVNAVGTTYETDENGNRTETVTGYTITCSAYRGDELKVKFPVGVADKIEELKTQLENDIEIEISFTGLKLTPYALKTKSGEVISGVSAKAEDFSVVSSKLDELMLDDVEI